MSEAPLTDAEIRNLRAILKGISGAEWRSLKALASGLVSASGAGGGPSNGGGAPSGGDELSDRFLDAQPWTDRTIAKDPRRWAGQPMAGYRYSEAPSDWHDVMAEHFEYKARKGREEDPPRLQTKGKNAGKPWHEADAFEAKICRAWARRNRGKALPPEASAGRSNDGGGGLDPGDEPYDGGAPMGDEETAY